MTTYPAPKPGKPLVSRAIRQSARDKVCTLRLHGCLPGSETVVLAHIRGPWSGIAQKPHDFLALYACDNCHSQLDGRAGERPDGWDVVRAHAETLIAMFDAGLIRVGKEGTTS